MSGTGQIPTPAAMPAWSAVTDGASTVVSLSGEWSAQGAAGTLGDVQGVMAQAGLRMVGFEASGLGHWDTSLLVFVSALRQAATEKHIQFDEGGLPQAVRRLLALVPEKASAPPRLFADAGFVGHLGDTAVGLTGEVVAVTGLVGEMVLRGGAALTGRARMRGVDLLACMADAGGSALGIVAIVNLLVGGILAFVGAVQLKRFGADIYVANLVGVAMVREMGALMTAIVMAGRTGGAYAAEIASMQGSEELDALRVVGIPVSDYLVLPRVLALTAMMPMLYLYGSAIGIFGGFAVSVAMLHLAPARFVGQLLGAVSGGQILFGFGKSITFGVLVAVAGCRIGLKAGRSATDVGRAATSAVVAGIVGVIALDAVFAVCANAVGF